MSEHQACLLPAVLAELLNDPRLPATTAALFKQLPVLPISEGYWERVGALRAEVIAGAGESGPPRRWPCRLQITKG